MLEINKKRLEQLEEFARIIKPYPVEYLYKYRSIKDMEKEYVKRIFTHREIYLSSPNSFNDPFESRPNLTFYKTGLKREKFIKEMIKEQFGSLGKKEKDRLIIEAKIKLTTEPGFIYKTYEKFIKTIGIYCLSEKNNDILMWAHYSDAHKGICLEFDASKMDNLFWQAFKVMYQEDYPVVNIMDIKIPKEFGKALLTKSKNHWEYEQERRIIKLDEEGGPGIHNFRTELLTGIIFGALIEDKDKEMVLGWISDYPSKITIYQAKINRFKYTLDIVKI